MRKLKILFFIASFILAVFLGYFFIDNNVEYSKNKVKINDFNIIDISGEGKFYKNQIIDKDNIQKIDISKQENINKLSIYVDNGTSFLFRFFDTFITVLPDSFLKYNQSKISFLSGEYYWDRKIYNKKKQAINNIIYLKNNKKLFLSQKGRIIITDTNINIWNYKGALTLWSEEEEYKIKEGVYLSLVDGKTPTPITFIPKPDLLRPANNLVISSLKDTIVQFQWKDLLDFKKNNETIYTLKLYSSKNMGKLYEELEKDISGSFSTERKTDSSNIPVDFSALIETNTIYWRVFPLDKTNNIEGEPSEIRKLQIANFLINNKTAQMPPKLEIDPPSISGNIVILSGEADSSSRLFIDGKEYEIDDSGRFNLNVSYEKEGIYTIIFELISPSDRKNVQKKIVRIH